MVHYHGINDEPNLIENSEENRMNLLYIYPSIHYYTHGMTSYDVVNNTLHYYHLINRVFWV